MKRKLSLIEQDNYFKLPLFQGVLARFPLAVREIAKVSVFGCEKYQKPMGDMSYLDLPNAYELYTDKVIRHLIDETLNGPVNTLDGGLLHAAQTAWNALARLEVYLRGQAAVQAKAETESPAGLDPDKGDK